jgi:hypothetical protein
MGNALTGLGIFLQPDYPALQAGLSHYGPSALFMERGIARLMLCGQPVAIRLKG